MREVVSKTAKGHGVVSRAENLFDCSRVHKSCFNSYNYFV